MLAIISELLFHWVERTAGQYLNRANNSRPAWGTQWDQAGQAQKASAKLGSDASAKAKLRAQVDSVSTFAELLQPLEQGDGVQLTPARFIELYRGMPPFLRSRIIDPSDLADLTRNDDWVRTHIQRRGSDGYCLFLDPNDTVLRQIVMNGNVLEASANYAVTSNGTLADNPKFSGKIFTANRFFNLYDQLPDSSRQKVFNDENIILALPKPVVAVGLYTMFQENDYGLIGFGSNPPSGPVVTTYPVLSGDVTTIYNILSAGVADSLTSAQISKDMQIQDPEAE